MLVPAVNAGAIAAHVGREGSQTGPDSAAQEVRVRLKPGKYVVHKILTWSSLVPRASSVTTSCTLHDAY